MAETSMSKRLNVIVPDELYEKLVKYAETERRTKSQLTVFAIEFYLNYLEEQSSK